DAEPGLQTVAAQARDRHARKDQRAANPGVAGSNPAPTVTWVVVSCRVVPGAAFVPARRPPVSARTAGPVARGGVLKRADIETLEKVSEKANLTVVLGEKGLADRVVKLL